MRDNFVFGDQVMVEIDLIRWRCPLSQERSASGRVDGHTHTEDFPLSLSLTHTHTQRSCPVPSPPLHTHTQFMYDPLWVYCLSPFPKQSWPRPLIISGHPQHCRSGSQWVLAVRDRRDTERVWTCEGLFPCWYCWATNMTHTTHSFLLDHGGVSSTMLLTLG